MPLTDRPTIRLAASLAVLALLGGCERTPPPPAAPVVTTAAPDAAAQTLVETFSTDDVRIGTEVGERSLGRGLSTTGKPGWLMFGPYIPLPAGNYQVALQGTAHEGHAGVVYLDVVQGKGTDVLAAANLEAPALLSPASPDGLAVIGFTLKQATTNLEVRVRVSETSNLSISGVVIRAVR